MKRNFKKFFSVALSIMLCATAVPASFVAANAADSNTVTPKVATGSNHTVVLKSDGTVWAVGGNDFNQLGVGNVELPTISGTPYTSTFIQCVDADGVKISDAKDVTCGPSHTVIIRGDNGEVWSCGSGQYGKLGNNSSGDNRSFAKSSRYTNGSSGAKEAITGATDIACGQYHTAVIINGEVWQCGGNGSGQLGNNSTNDSYLFVKSSKYTNGSSGAKEEITGAKQIACGSGYTAVILENGEVWQCGGNSSGQLGNRNTTDRPIFVKSYKSKTGEYLASPDSSNTEAITGATDIACGSSYTAVILENGEVWSCGSNGSGQLGNGSTTKSPVFVKSSKYINGIDGDTEAITGARQIVCGTTHTAVILENGEVWQCGSNDEGQLGIGSEKDSKIFVKSSNITNAKELSTGYADKHTMAICTEADVTYALYGVGNNDNGQLGLGYKGNNDDTTPLDYITTFAKSTTIGDIGSAITADIDTIEALNVPKDRNVTGAGQFVNAYKMEVEWGSLSYKYEAKWDTEKSAWGEGTWKLTDEKDEDAGKIIVRNFSSIPCKSVFSFEPNSNFKAPSDDQPGTKGVFEDLKVEKEPLLTTVNEPVESTGETEGTQKTTPVTSATLAVYTEANTVGHQKTVKLKLEGIPESKKGTNINSGTNIGKTTVTFKKVS